jgi:hypothetical protein
MKNFRYQLLLLFIVVVSAFSFVPPPHRIPERNQFVPTVVYDIPPVTALTVFSPKLTASKGETICVPVKTKDFHQILSMQYSMNWDANVLKFKEVRNYGLEGMGLQSFGSHLSAKGILTFSWYDPGLHGFSKPDETTLYEVCFDAIGNPGSKSAFEFSGQPTSIEIANAASVFLNLKAENGEVKIEGVKH